MKTPRFTDAHRFPRPYVTAEQSRAAGYLADRFRLIREQQEKDEAERKAKLRTMRKSA